MYDDRKSIELGKCDYNVVSEMLGEPLKDKVRQQYGLSQATIDNLNLENEEHTILYTSQKPTKTFKQIDRHKIQYINATRTQKEEMELQHQLVQRNLETRQREQHAIDKGNGTKIQINTHSLK